MGKQRGKEGKRERQARRPAVDILQKRFVQLLCLYYHKHLCVHLICLHFPNLLKSFHVTLQLFMNLMRCKYLIFLRLFCQVNIGPYCFLLVFSLLIYYSSFHNPMLFLRFLLALQHCLVFSHQIIYFIITIDFQNHSHCWGWRKLGLGNTKSCWICWSVSWLNSLSLSAGMGLADPVPAQGTLACPCPLTTAGITAS